MAGSFPGTVDFDPGGSTYNRTSNGDEDAFLSLIDSSGTWQWTRTFGGVDNDNGLGVSVTSTGEAYITGMFRSTVDFAPTEPPCNDNSDEHDSIGNTDAYLVKYLSDGCW